MGTPAATGAAGLAPCAGEPRMSLVARLRALTRLLLVHGLYYTGTLHLIKRRRLRGRAVVLMYHRVLNAPERERSFSSDGILVSPQTFDRQLGFLRRHFNVVTPEQFVERLRRGEPFDDATCLITFDDGWIDNFTNALPLLRKHALPAVVFLPTGFIGTDRCFWQERLARLLYRLHGLYRTDPSETSAIVEGYGLKQVFRSKGAELKREIHDYVRALKSLPEEEVERMAEAVAAVVREHGGAEAHPDRFLSWDEVRAMAADGVRFGSHAVTHRILTRLDRGTVARELAQSQREIADRLGAPVELLAYPNGDSNSEVAEAARTAGYAAAFTTRPGTVAAGEHPYLVPRVNIHDRATRTVAGFYAAVLGVL